MTGQSVIELPIVTRSAPVQSVDQDKRTVDLVFSSGSSVRRSYWQGNTWVPYDEIILVSEAAINMERLQAGAPVLESHDSYSTHSQVAVVDRAWIDGDKACAQVRFPSSGIDPAADRMWSLVSEGIVRNVSVGYSQDTVRIVDPEKKGDVEQRIVERWTPFEISFVTIPADPKAQVRAEDVRPDGVRTYPTLISKSNSKEQEMSDELNPHAERGLPEMTLSASVSESSQDHHAIERTRAIGLMELAKRHEIDMDLVQTHITAGTSLTDFRSVVLDYLDKHSAARKFPSIIVTNPGESPTQRLSDMADGIVLRCLGRNQVANKGMPKIENIERARPYANRTLLHLGAELCGMRDFYGMHPAELYNAVQYRSMHGTTDYPLLLSNVANKFLMAQYEYQKPSYKSFSIKKPFNDFKNHSFLRLGDFPMLEKVNEAGEITSGTISEQGHQVAAETYSRIIRLSRKMIVNDDLSAFSDLMGLAGRRISDSENKIAWQYILGPAGRGPILNDQIGKPLFDKDRGNYIGTGTNISVPNVDIARQLMLQQKSLDGVPLTIMPSLIVVGSKKITEVEQLLSTHLNATQTININPFNGGGLTKLEPVLEGYIGDNSWYLFADPSAVPTFVYGYVNGFDGPRFEIARPFETSGLALKVELDFAFGAVDHIGAFLNEGA